MKAVKFMISGALLILLGPVMSSVDIWFSGFHVLCWVAGIPLFFIGLLMPADGISVVVPDDALPQKECPQCGKHHDFDYPKCPFCKYNYNA